MIKIYIEHIAVYIFLFIFVLAILPKDFLICYLMRNFWYSEPDEYGVRKCIPWHLVRQLPFKCYAIFGCCKFDFQNDERYSKRTKHRPIMKCHSCPKCSVVWQGVDYSPETHRRDSDRAYISEFPFFERCVVDFSVDDLPF